MTGNTVFKILDQLLEKYKIMSFWKNTLNFSRKKHATFSTAEVQENRHCYRVQPTTDLVIRNRKVTKKKLAPELSTTSNNILKKFQVWA